MCGRDSLSGRRLGPVFRPKAEGFRVISMGRHEGAQAGEGVEGDAAAIAQTRNKLSIIDAKPPEGGFREAREPAKITDLVQNFLSRHGAFPPCPSLSWRRKGIVAHAGMASTTK